MKFNLLILALCAVMLSACSSATQPPESDASTGMEPIYEEEMMDPSGDEGSAFDDQAEQDSVNELLRNSN